MATARKRKGQREQESEQAHRARKVADAFQTLRSKSGSANLVTGRSLNAAVTLSTTAFVVGLLFGALTLYLSAAPGVPELRPFAICCMFGALYAACNAIMASDVSPRVGLWAAEISLVFGGLHGASWLYYRIVRERRPPFLYEKVLIGGVVVAGASTLVPGLVYSGVPWQHSVQWFHVTYQDGETTGFANVVYAFLCFAFLIPLVRAVRRLRAGDRSELTDVLGLTALLSSGAHDSLATVHVLPTPYILDLGFLFLMLFAGGAVAKRFISNARALEESAARLQSTQEELVRRERLAALGEMSAVVAHEVRNPLGVIFNALASIRHLPPQADEREQLLRIVEEEADRLKRMVSDLLEFAQPRRLALESVVLEPLVAGAVEAARSSLADVPADIGVDVDVASTLPPVICDERLVRQAIVNLVVNALQAPGRHEPVRVRARLEGESVVISVIDDGEGVAEEHRKRIFLPFFTTRATGTGLGLPVVQRIAEAHGGGLTHEPTPGGGATFVLRLPARTSVAPVVEE